MPAISQGRRLPEWRAMRAVGVRGLALLAAAGLTAASLTACTSAYPPFGPPNTLSLSDDHTEIIMTGSMRDGLSAQVEQILKANPAISAIKLESPGGSGNEGYKLALLVKEHHLATFSARLCASACTFVYMAGEPRFLVASAKLGFHSSSVNGVASPAGNKFSQILYQEAGVPQAFIDRALATAPNDIWFPTTQELLQAHVVTDLVVDQYFLPSRRKYWTSDAQLDASLKADRTVATIARVDPANYTKIRRIFLDGARDGRGIAQMMASSRDFISGTLMVSYFRRAPDDLVIQYRQLQLEALRDIEHNAPGTCVTVAAPKNSITDFSDKRLSAKINSKLDLAMTNLITAAVQRPDHPDDDLLNYRTAEEFEKTTLVKSEVFNRSLSALKSDSTNQVLYCRVMEAYDEVILDQPPVTAARIIRAHELTRKPDVAGGVAASH